MNKKGFTIIEILVAVVILGIIAAIAIPVYNNINNAAKQKNYDNKINQIELAAEKWADENNLSRPITIPILQLVQQGALSADEGTTDSVIEPVNNTDIKCHSINITFENYVPQAEYIDKEINNCQAKLEEENDPNIILTAYQVGRSDNSNQGELIYQTNTKELDWTKNNVQVLINIDDSTIYNFTDNSKITFSGSGINQTRSLAEGYTICSNYQTDISKCANAVSVTGNNLIATIYATIETTEGLKSKEVTVKIDNQAPTVNAIVDNEEKWVNHDRTITIDATDGNVGSGLANITVEGETIDDFSGSYITQKGLGKYTIVATDNAGNSSGNITVEVTNIDVTKPTADFSKTSNWINTNRSVTIKGNDSEAGIKGYFVSTSANETLEGNKTTALTTPYSISNNGTYYIYTVDNAGNLSEPKKMIESYIDKIKPSAGYSKGNTWINTNRSLTVLGSDSQSGVAGYFISTSLNQTSSSNKTTSINTKYSIVNNGTYYIYIVDNAGNISDPKAVVESTIDRLSPTVALRNTGASSYSVNAIATPYDSFGEIESVKLYINNSLKYTSYGYQSTNYNFTGLSPSTTYTIKAVVTDKAGNSSQATLNMTTAKPPNYTLNINKYLSIYYSTGGCEYLIYTIPSGYNRIISVNHHLVSYSNHHTGLAGDAFIAWQLIGNSFSIRVCSSSAASHVSATYYITSATFGS